MRPPTRRCISPATTSRRSSTTSSARSRLPSTRARSCTCRTPPATAELLVGADSRPHVEQVDERGDDGDEGEQPDVRRKGRDDEQDDPELLRLLLGGDEGPG